jgi:hypothetical protein
MDRMYLFSEVGSGGKIIFFIGIVSLVLLTIGIVSLWINRYRLALMTGFLCTIFCFLFAMTSDAPLFQYFYEWIPPIRSLRAHNRVLVFCRVIHVNGCELWCNQYFPRTI